MFNILSMNDSIAMDVVRTIAAALDKAVYSLISAVYNLILILTSIQPFSDETISEFSGRLYTLIGIFMLFKISFSIINYIINPDSIFDKSQGSSKLIKNIVITFVLIIMMPTIFSLMTETQNAILNDHIIENFILGTSGSTSSNQFKISESCSSPVYVDDNGDYIALVIFRPFYQVDENGRNTSGLLSGDYCTANSVNGLLKNNIYNSPNSSSTGIGLSGIYDVDYWFIISTIIGGAVLLILVNFAMDIAVRSIKIAFLEIIAPIPIMSYIDPNKSKNGMLSKWGKELGKTWADLFIRLIALYFVIKILTMIDNITLPTGISSFYKNVIYVFVIVGGLMFAKQLPTLIGNILGIKIDGGFNINPLKKIEKDAFGGKFLASLPGKTATAVGGMALGATGAVIGHHRASADFNRKLGEQDSKYAAWAQKQRNALANASTAADKKRIIVSGFPEFQQIQEDRQKIVDDYNSKFSNKHYIAAGLMEALRGTKIGFKNEGKNPIDVIDKSSKAAKLSAEMKNNADIMTIKRRREDFWSDIAGVKNESGTTSELSKDIKKENEHLSNLENYIAQLNHSIGSLKPGLISYTKDQNGETVLKANSDPTIYQGSGITKQQVETMLFELSQMRAEQKAANKHLKELEEAKKIERISEGPKKGK